MAMLPRDILKWLQSLQLSVPVRNVRRDFSNGYLVAEILSKCCASSGGSSIRLGNFSMGAALDLKLGNWRHLAKVR